MFVAGVQFMDCNLMACCPASKRQTIDGRQPRSVSDSLSLLRVQRIIAGAGFRSS
jgi:hypothetical protein